jgi:hypothetical protein
MLLAFSWGIAQAAEQKFGVSLDRYIEIFRQGVPEHAGKTVFLLIGAFVRSAEKDPIGEIAPIEGPLLAKILEAIELARGYEVDPKWLKTSKEYVDEYQSRGSFDLLGKFLELLDLVIQQGRVPPSPIVDNDRSFVRELREKRDALTKTPKRSKI